MDIIGRTTLPSSVSDGNRAYKIGDKFGRQVIVAQAPRELVGTQVTTITTTAETTIVTAGGSGVFNDISSILIVNTSAIATRIDIRDTTAGSIVQTLYAPAGDLRGVSWQVPFPQTSANTNWTITLGTAVTDVRITVQFIKNK